MSINLTLDNLDKTLLDKYSKNPIHQEIFFMLENLAHPLSVIQFKRDGEYYIKSNDNKLII